MSDQACVKASAARTVYIVLVSLAVWGMQTLANLWCPAAASMLTPAFVAVAGILGTMIVNLIDHIGHMLPSWLLEPVPGEAAARADAKIDKAINDGMKGN